MFTPKRDIRIAETLFVILAESFGKCLIAVLPQHNAIEVSEHLNVLEKIDQNRAAGPAIFVRVGRLNHGLLQSNLERSHFIGVLF